MYTTICSKSAALVHGSAIFVLVYAGPSSILLSAYYPSNCTAADI